MTVASVLNKHTEEIYGRINSRNFKGCTDLIEGILNAEGGKCSKVDVDRCVKTLRSSERNESKYLSTLVTWLSAIKC